MQTPQDKWRPSRSTYQKRAMYRKSSLHQSTLPEPAPSQRLLESTDKVSNIDKPSNSPTKIENVEVIATYNWQDTTDPVMLVPGRPPRWQDPIMTRKLKEDNPHLTYYRDMNSARYGTFPTEPAVRAIQTLKPEFDISQAEIFACGNTIGSLLHFAFDEERTFRFGVELIESTLFLVRKIRVPRETIDDINGFGHTFPEAYTTWDRDVKGSASHQRIIGYDFGGLKCFVRSESDGYFPDLAELDKFSETSKQDSKDSVADLERIAALNFGSQESSSTDTLTLHKSGVLIPQKAIFDLKTRSINKKPAGYLTVEDEFLRRLWANQTPNFVLAYHHRGIFNKQDIHILDVEAKVKEWEARNKSTLGRLAAVLHYLIDFARLSSRSRFEVRRVGEGPLEFWSEVPEWSALPEDLKKTFANNDEDDGSVKIEKEAFVGVEGAGEADTVKSSPRGNLWLKMMSRPDDLD